MTNETEAQVLLLLAHLVEERVGLHFSDKDHDIFQLKVAAHVDELGFESLLDFYYALRYDDPTSQRTNALIDALIVGETYFFRELPGLERVVEHVGERARAGRSSRIWSAACATGEEPLSLAVLLARAGLLDQVELVATDVSPRQLARARSGDHTRRALRNHPDGMAPWLRAEGGRPVVDPRIRDRIDWRLVNLVDAQQVGALGTFDAVLCRNVLIYFDDATMGRVATALTDALAPDGILVIGASESLLRLGTMLVCTERNGTFLYRRNR